MQKNHFSSRLTLKIAFLILPLLGLVLAGKKASAVTFHVVPEESTVTLAADINGGLFVTEQSPGSLSSNIMGTLEATITPGFISFGGGSNLDVIEQPGPFLPGNVPADLAGKIQNLLPTIDGSAVALDAVFDVINDPQAMSGSGEFSTAGMQVFFMSGTTAFEVPGVITSSYDYGGQFDIFVPKMGTLEDIGGGVLKLTIPFEVSEIIETPLMELVLTQTITGQIVAVVPEPATWLLSAIGLAVCGLWRLSRVSMIATAFFSVLLSSSCCTSVAFADPFGSGSNAFEIEFVRIGNPGNIADNTGSPDSAGAVPYVYQIGKYEISAQMIDKANAASAESGNPLNITQSTLQPNDPAGSVSWLEAARFVNWLNTSTGNRTAYKFDSDGNFQVWQPGDVGYDSTNVYRNQLARYFLPSTDEWYKAAYYDPINEVYYDYPTGSDSPPTPVASGTAPGTAVYSLPFATGHAEITMAGGLSPYGTMAQGGNMWEMEETDRDLINDSSSPARRGRRGGDWIDSANDNSGFMRSSFRTHIDITSEFGNVTFRVASVPEPSTLVLACMALVGGLLVWRVRVPR